MVDTDKRIKEHYATHDDLHELRAELKAEFKGLRDEFTASFTMINNKLGKLGTTNWGTVIAGLTVILVIVGLTASLISYIIASEREARVTADHFIENSVTTFLKEDYVPLRQRSIDAIKDLALLEEKVKQFDNHRLDQITVMKTLAAIQVEINSLKDEAKLTRTTLNDMAQVQASQKVEIDRGASDHTLHTQRFIELDAMVQREMRLLDDVMQREMKLEIARLEALTAINTTRIQELQKEDNKP